MKGAPVSLLYLLLTIRLLRMCHLRMKTLGLADYHFRNAIIRFVDGKIKSKINKTLPWLCSKPQNN